MQSTSVHNPQTLILLRRARFMDSMLSADAALVCLNSRTDPEICKALRNAPDARRRLERILQRGRAQCAASAAGDSTFLARRRAPVHRLRSLGAKATRSKQQSSRSWSDIADQARPSSGVGARAASGLLLAGLSRPARQRALSPSSSGAHQHRNPIGTCRSKRTDFFCNKEGPRVVVSVACKARSPQIWWSAR